MGLKQLRLDQNYSQEQLATMSGLSVRTIQRIERGQKSSVESLKCIASVLQVDISILNEEEYMVSKDSEHWQNLPLWLKAWFTFNFLTTRPTRRQAMNIEYMCHISGFLFVCVGLLNKQALVGGIFLLCVAYFSHLLLWQGDIYNVWYSPKNT